ncbi:MAG: anaerobic ribonucleoside-triphosphate reductase activating protein [Eubacterium sp.]|nr:anaerobic ribonucleoside-triphosphate reductase activating protein [Eubacterium sp.]
MNIHGLQKMTLLDFPGKVACTVFLAGCDMRCPYCHNWELVDMTAPVIMDHVELLKFLEGRKGLLDGVAFTGGEPLLRNDLEDLIRSIRDMGFAIKLDTNGNHPDRLKSLVGKGLIDYVAMDVKNSPERYGQTIGIEDFETDNIDESIRFLLEGRVDYEFRTTVVKQFHDENSFQSIARWIAGAKNYFIQGFVDRETVRFAGLEGYSPEELEAFISLVRPFVDRAEVRGS